MNSNKIITETEISKKLTSNPIGLVTGSFDFLHLGHMQMLAQAKSKLAMDERLLVIVLGDEQIRLRKGDDRPYFKLAERLEALTYLEVVDYVYGWERPWQELRNFVLEHQPKYLFALEDDPGLENKRMHVEKSGGELVILDKYRDYSTTKILNEILH